MIGINGIVVEAGSALPLDGGVKCRQTEWMKTEKPRNTKRGLMMSPPDECSEVALSAEERLDISLPAEVMRRLDEAVELLDFSDRQEFIVSVLRRFLDRMGIAATGSSNNAVVVEG